MKKTVFKIYFTLAFLSLIFLNAFAVDPIKFELSGRWSFICFSDSLTNFEECPIINNENDFFIEFDPDGKEGIIYGRSSYNFLNGEYLIDSLNNVRLKNMGGTKRNELTKCSRMFYDAFRNSTSVFLNEGRLNVTYGSENKLMKFVKAQKNNK